MGSDKRRFTRIRLNMPATLQLADGRIYLTDHLENLSIGGCLLPVRSPLEIGAECRVSITLGAGPEVPAIVVMGVLVRTEGDMAGIRFEWIDPDALFHLQNLIRYNAADPDRITAEISRHPGLV